ncbi:MAG: phosphate uptake regulator PhoU [Thermoplasmata archaeon]|nr:phosphate uptake regulator PhoU [Thermoplasmata archaeon]
MLASEAAELPSKEQETNVRRVQRTGRTSLAVTLPKAWTGSHGVVTGTPIELRDLGDGRLELSIATGRATSPEHLKILQIDASDATPSLLPRLLIGAYITGNDRILITARSDLSPEVRAKVAEVAHRILGMSLVEEEPRRLEVRVFLDASKHRLSSLQSRVVRMIELELEVCSRSLETADPQLLGQLPNIEEEVDRFYLLMARQLLLAANDHEIAREIGVQSHHYQMGYRLVAKMLEVIADLIAKIGRELAAELPRGKDAEEIRQLLVRFSSTLTATMRAFSSNSASEADDALEGVHAATQELAELSGSLIGRSRDRENAARFQRILSELGTGHALLVVINETTVNRAVEPETTAPTGGRVLLARRPSRA